MRADRQAESVSPNVTSRRRHSNAEAVVRDLLRRADIRIGGDRPWDIAVHDPRFYGRVLSDTELGVGESYMDGWWDCEAIDQMVTRALQAELRTEIRNSLQTSVRALWASLVNRQRRSRAFQVGEHHYDLGNDLFEVMLDSRLAYSCAYWKGARTLHAAQEAKLDLVGRKIGLEPGDKVLDVGCGWGSFLSYAAEQFGARAIGLTVSREQARYIRDRYDGLPVAVHVQDYRDHEGQYDHVVSIGMFEHVGTKNYRTFFECMHRFVADDGLFLFHTITDRYSGRAVDRWTEKYIFPNGDLPSPAQITAAAEGLFVLEDVHNIGAYYDPTLMAWHENFEAGWSRLADRYGARFRRMWRYYLLSCAGSFRARSINVWQAVFSKKGVSGGYRTVR